ncbi:MAG: hydrogenase expression/formation protein, partial [Candidatus Lokiarchaeota archaeon]|nr:hydrogenase expression/formation protein [Candidatus Lokiarchaeota archaeon]
MLKDFASDLINQDKRVIMGSKIGEDAAVIDMGNKYLVAKTDPITFTTDEIGYYAVNVNVNDVVCMGAKPKWFQSTILLPEN